MSVPYIEDKALYEFIKRLLAKNKKILDENKLIKASLADSQKRIRTIETFLNGMVFRLKKFEKLPITALDLQVGEIENS
jgi:hypothetical protein